MGKHQQTEAIQTQIFVKNTFVYIEDNDDACISVEFYPRSQTSPADVCTNVMDQIELASERAECQGAENADAARRSMQIKRNGSVASSIGATITTEPVVNHLRTPRFSVRNTFVHVEEDDDELCPVTDRQPRSQTDPAKCSSFEELCSADVKK